MTHDATKLLKRALGLSAEERAELAGSLLESLDGAPDDPEAVEQAAKKYVDLEHLQFVCVGDGKQIKDTLKKYGPVEVYDADGKRLE